MNFKQIRIVIAPLIIAIITFIAYFPSLFYDFQFDDNLAILRQFNIRNDTLFSLFFKGTRWVGDWVNALNFAINKFDPFVFRSTNLIIHITTLISVFFFLLLLFSLIKKNKFIDANKGAIAFIATLLFALHPVQTQTVSYIIQGRLEGLSALFIISAIICFISYTRSDYLITKWLSIFSIFALITLACGTKEISIVAPFLILLFDWFFIAQGTFKKLFDRLRLHLSIFAFTAAIYIYFKKQFIIDALTLNVKVYNNVGNILTNSVTDQIKPIPFFLSQFKVILHYLWIFIWPFDISVEYDWKLSKGFFAIDCIIPLLLLIILATIIFLLLKKNRTNIFGFGMLWFAICILPRSTIIPSGELLVDYKTYLASIGIFLIFALALVKVGIFIASSLTKDKIIRQRLLIIFATALVLFLAFFSWRRNMVWQSDLVFWKDIIDHAPLKARAHNNYAIALIKENRHYEAIAHLKQALKLQNGNYWDPFTNLSIAYCGLGKIEMAIESIKQALRINPYHPESFNSLGLLFLQKQKLDDAQKAFEVAIALRPHYGKALFNLGQVYIQKKDLEKAWESFRDCCMKGDFDTVLDGFSRYAAISIHLKKFDDAIIGYKKMLEIDPNLEEAHLNLANAYYYKEDFDNAYKFYQSAAKINPNDFRPLSNMAQIHLKMGQPEKALMLLNNARKIEGAPLELEIKIAYCLDLMEKNDAARKLLEKLALQNEDTKVKHRAQQLLKT